MGILDRLFGNDRRAPRHEAPAIRGVSPDTQALERYRYMMQTAPPETIEQAHEEAFARLTLSQRQEVLRELAKSAPPGELSSVQSTSSEDPRAMARLATRAEIRQPGIMERALSGGPSMAGTLLTSLAAGFVGSMVAQSFFSAMGGAGDSEEAGAGDEQATADNDSEESHDDDGGFADDVGDFEV